MKKLSITILFILLISLNAGAARYLEGHGRHMIVNEWYPNGTCLEVTPNNGIVNIQLENTYISFDQVTGDPTPCIDIKEGNQVRIILKGENFLQGGRGCPAIRVHPKSELFIDDSEGWGQLIALGGGSWEAFYNDKSLTIPGGAGIGGGWGDYLADYPYDFWRNDVDPMITHYLWHTGTIPDYHFIEARYKNAIPEEYKWSSTWWSQGWGAFGKIHINGGDIYAVGGGWWAAGIGTSGMFTKGKEIVIQHGANVHALGGKYAAGIGGSDYCKIDEIKTTDANSVVAIGGRSAPGIGVRDHSYIQHINLEGGDIIATGGEKGAVGIGLGGNSVAHFINISTTVVAKGSEGQAAIGNARGYHQPAPGYGLMTWDRGHGGHSRIEHLQFFSGANALLENGISGDIDNIRFHGGNITVDDISTHDIHGNVIYNGGQIITNKYLEFDSPQGKVATRGKLLFDTEMYDLSGYSIKIGGENYSSYGDRLDVIYGLEHHLMYPTNKELGKVEIYKGDILRFREIYRDDENEFSWIYLEAVNTPPEEIDGTILIARNGEYEFQDIVGKSIMVRSHVNAKIKLKNVNLISQSDDNTGAMAIEDHATVVLELEGNNVIDGTNSQTPAVGIELQELSRLIIQGDGKLTALGGANNPGIGQIPDSIFPLLCGDLVINGGNVTVSSIGNDNVTGNLIEVNGGYIEVTDSIYGIITMNGGTLAGNVSHSSWMDMTGGSFRGNLNSELPGGEKITAVRFAPDVPDSTLLTNYQCLIKGKPYNLTDVRTDEEGKIYIAIPPGNYSRNDITILDNELRIYKNAEMLTVNENSSITLSSSQSRNRITYQITNSVTSGLEMQAELMPYHKLIHSGDSIWSDSVKFAVAGDNRLFDNKQFVYNWRVNGQQLPQTTVPYISLYPQGDTQVQCEVLNYNEVYYAFLGNNYGHLLKVTDRNTNEIIPNGEHRSLGTPILIEADSTLAGTFKIDLLINSRLISQNLPKLNYATTIEGKTEINVFIQIDTLTSDQFDEYINWLYYGAGVNYSTDTRTLRELEKLLSTYNTAINRIGNPDLKINTKNGAIVIENVDKNEAVSIYSLKGTLLKRFSNVDRIEFATKERVLIIQSAAGWSNKIMVKD
jgi:hypothetical protein